MRLLNSTTKVIFQEIQRESGEKRTRKSPKLESCAACPHCCREMIKFYTKVESIGDDSTDNATKYFVKIRMGLGKGWDYLTSR